jgi:hypothetical protein
MKVRDYKIIGFDLKPVDLHMPGLFTYVQDITEKEKVRKILKEH